MAKLDFAKAVADREGTISSGYVLQNYWGLLEAEFKHKGNKLLSVIELWTWSKQGSKTLNEWLTYVYNLVESCDYGESNDRIIRDVLIIGCNFDKAKDKIVWQGEKIRLQEVIEILQLEDSTRPTLSEMNSTTHKIHYASYEKKSKGGGKKQKTQPNPNVSSSSSIGQETDSTGPQKLSYQCKKPYTKRHEKVCKAQNAKCNACGIMGHYESACKKSGNFPQKSSNLQKPSKVNIVQGLFVPFACVGSGDPVMVLRLYTTNTLDILWNIYCWDICTTCRYRSYVLLYSLIRSARKCPGGCSTTWRIASHCTVWCFM